MTAARKLIKDNQKKHTIMKKILLALALVITMSFGAKAQFFGMSDGFFNDWGTSDAIRTNGFLPLIPTVHGEIGDQSAAPLGSGLVILTALGTGYAVARRRKNSR